jgi:hypothetical protein
MGTMKLMWFSRSGTKSISQQTGVNIMLPRAIVVVVMMFASNGTSISQEVRLLRIEGGLTLSHFQQQVKAEIGGDRGQRLVYEESIGFVLTGGYRIHNLFYIGLYSQYDGGKRTLALFDGFDDEGRTRVRNTLGGVYREFWFGPLVQFTWKTLSVEWAYAAIGMRSDDGRKDIPAADGDVSKAFRTHPTIAWMFSVGAAVPVLEQIDLVVRIQYRARYYNKRGSKDLIDNIDHGTQSISPLIGLSWRF